MTEDACLWFPFKKTRLAPGGLEIAQTRQNAGPDQGPGLDTGVASVFSEQPDFGQSSTVNVADSWQRYWIQIAGLIPVVIPLLIIGCATIAALDWLLDSYVWSGTVAQVPGFRPITAFGCVLMAFSVLLLRNTPGAGLRHTCGSVLAAAGGIVGLLVIFNGVGLGPDVNWHATGPLQQPSGFGSVVLVSISLGLLTLDRDPPRYRWPDVLMPLSGFLFLFAVVGSGYRFDIFSTGREPIIISGTLVLALGGLYISYVCLRTNRSVTGFLLAEGPGPSMARVLIPTALVIPVFVAVTDWLLGSLDIGSVMARRSSEMVLIVSGLVAVVTFSSRRLQGFYNDWRVANAALVEQSAVLRDMAEGVAVIRKSDGLFVLTNPQFASMHGYTGDELIGLPFEAIAPLSMSETEIEVREKVKAELLADSTSSYENQARCKDGSLIWCRAHASIMQHPFHGEVITLVKSDITDERRARIAQGKAESRFKGVFEASPIGLCMVNGDFTFASVNPAFEKMTGFTSEEFESMTFVDITHPDDIDADVAFSEKFFRGEIDGFEMEKRYVHKDGSVIWASMTVSRMPSGRPDEVIALAMVEDITEKREFDIRMKHMADHDALTGLLNRRRFEKELEEAVMGKSQLRDDLAVLVVDIDNFKFINDTYGHSVGDQIISRLANVLDGRVRATDTVARLGGDEFVVIFRGITRDAAMVIAEDLTSLVRNGVRVDGIDFSARVTVSIGLALSSPDDDADDKTLLAQADKAMYAAKDGGRDRVRLYDPEDAGEVGQSFGWVERIRSALENSEFELFAQPIIDFKGDEKPMYELFLRMQDPDGSRIAPGAFLPVAERHDLIQSIDAWVLDAAIELLATRGGPEADFRVCVNLSGRSVGDPRLVELISSRLAESAVDPARLVFEVTETSAIGNIAQAQDFAATLDELGCRFALDDFGTGFATFYYLKHITCDYLKIDGEFVRYLVDDPTNRLVVQALVDIARGMGKKTIAEQIEDEPTLMLLAQYGVDFAQGFHTGRPAPLDEIDFNARPRLPVHSARRIS